MRIVQLIQAPQRRGAEIFASQLADALRDRGHETRRVFLYDGDGDFPMEHGDVLLRGDESHRLERSLGAHPQLLRKLLAALEAFRPDVVQANGSRTVKYAALARRLQPRGGWRAVYRNIGDPAAWLNGTARRVFYRVAVRRGIDGLVALLERDLPRLRRLYPRVPAAVIPTAVPLELAPATGRDRIRGWLGVGRGDPVVAVVGRLSREKRPDRALRVFARVRTAVPAARLWVAGSGPEAEALSGEVARLELGHAVSLLGSVDDVPSLLGAADVLLLTSDTEGIPGVVLEAGLLGLPVVAADVGGVADCVRDGETGLLAPAGDEEALAQALERVLLDPELRRRLGTSAAARVRARYGMDAVAPMYETFYRRLAGVHEVTR